jgi:hypothetical protein
MTIAYDGACQGWRLLAVGGCLQCLTISVHYSKMTADQGVLISSDEEPSEEIDSESHEYGELKLMIE